MANVENFKKAFDIMCEHDPYEMIAAEHDEVFAATRPHPDSEAGKELKALGWRWDDSLECWHRFV